MAEGMMKSAPSGVAAAPVVTKDTQPLMSMDGVPYGMMEYFGTNAFDMNERERRQMVEIYNMFSERGMDMGDMWLELRGIEQKLGAPAHNETRYSKVYNYMKVSRSIDILKKQRESLENGKRTNNSGGREENVDGGGEGTRSSVDGPSDNGDTV